MCSLDSELWNYKTVYLNAHTSPKGTWMTVPLNALAAKIHHFAPAPNTPPSIFIFGRAESLCESYKLAEIAEMKTLSDKFKNANFNIHKKFARSSEWYGTNYKNGREAACILLIKKLEKYLEYFNINRELETW